MRETVRVLMAHKCDRDLHAGHSKHSQHRSVPLAARLQGSPTKNTSEVSDDLEPSPHAGRQQSATTEGTRNTLM